MNGMHCNCEVPCYLQSCNILIACHCAGSSLQAQAAAMGFPSVDQPLQAGAATGSPPNNLLGMTVGSIVAFCCFVALLIGEPDFLESL